MPATPFHSDVPAELAIRLRLQVWQSSKSWDLLHSVLYRCVSDLYDAASVFDILKGLDFEEQADRDKAKMAIEQSWHKQQL